MPVTYYMQGIILYALFTGDFWAGVALATILCVLAIRYSALSRAL